MLCEQVLETLVSKKISELPPDIARQVQEHLASCPECQKFFDDYKKINEALTPGDSAAISDERLAALEKKILGKISWRRRFLPQIALAASVAIIASLVFCYLKIGGSAPVRPPVTAKNPPETEPVKPVTPEPVKVKLAEVKVALLTYSVQKELALLKKQVSAAVIKEAPKENILLLNEEYIDKRIEQQKQDIQNVTKMLQPLSTGLMVRLSREISGDIAIGVQLIELGKNLVFMIKAVDIDKEEVIEEVIFQSTPEAPEAAIEELSKKVSEIILKYQAEKSGQ